MFLYDFFSCKKKIFYLYFFFALYSLVIYNNIRLLKKPKMR
jgi:hypothetical protein